MRILMIDNIAFVGENLSKGLEKEGHEVTFITKIRWIDILQKKYGKEKYDIVHIHSPNFKKLVVAWRYLKNSKLVCHWHGSDLRHPRHAFPVYRYLKKKADFNLYSTLDLAWWLGKISNDKKMLFTCPIDTDLFKPDGSIKKGDIEFRGGGKSIKVHRIPHNEMPQYLNQFKVVNVYNADGLDDGLLSVVAMEAAACGCFVPQIPWLDRNWVIDNADINLQADKLIKIYENLLKGDN
jgi:hypothetical protein